MSNATVVFRQTGIQSTAFAGFVDRAKACLRAIGRWRSERRAVRHLRALSDRELKDIGIHRCEVSSVVHGNSRDVTRRRNYRVAG
jgi:uncharacterized protein YjiS (DUF1127 family)